MAEPAAGEAAAAAHAPATTAAPEAMTRELTPPTAPSYLSQVVRIAAKDLRIEWRSREIAYTMAFLAVVIVLVFASSFAAGDTRPSPEVTAGILWIAVVFSGTVALSRTFERERDGEAMRALLLTPAPRSAIYLGKLLATAALMLAVELIVTPLCAVFFSAAITAHAARVGLMLALGTVGFAAVGSIFSAALTRSRSRDVLLSTLLYPVIVPIMIAGARGTTLLLDPESPDTAGAVFWTQFLAAVDIVFITVGLWAFEPVATGE